MDVRFPQEGMPKLPSFNLGPWLVPVFVILIALLSTGSLFYQH